MIIRNADALSNDYLPDNLLHRERELKELRFSVYSFVKYSAPQNMFLYGSTGVGKTASVRLITERTEAELSGVEALYVNCWKDHTRMSVLNEIGDKLKLVLPRRGIAVDELCSRIESFFSRSKLKMIIILDEADRLIFSKYSKDSILYDLCRMQNNKIMLFLLSNNSSLPFNIDDRIRSSLNLKSLEFKPYSVIQLKDILGARAKIAFFPGTYDDDVIGLVAAISSKRGDARIAISLLREAAALAEYDEKTKISVDDIYAAKEKLLEFKKREHDEVERQIIELLRENKKLNSGELYKKLSHINDRTLRNKLDTLTDTGVILKKEIRVGRGRSFEYSINENMS